MSGVRVQAIQEGKATQSASAQCSTAKNLLRQVLMKCARSPLLLQQAGKACPPCESCIKVSHANPSALMGTCTAAGHHKPKQQGRPTTHRLCFSAPEHSWTRHEKSQGERSHKSSRC